MRKKSLDEVEDGLIASSIELARRNPYYLFCDVETTGLDPVRNDIIACAFILTDTKYKILEKKASNVKPLNLGFWSEDAERIHGITSSIAMTYQHPFDVCIEMLRFLAPYRSDSPIRFIYHANGPFDWHFIKWLFMKQELEYSLYKVLNWKNLDSTMRMARQKKHKKVSLDALAKQFGVPLDHHNAESDVNACMKIHQYLSDSN